MMFKSIMLIGALCTLLQFCVAIPISYDLKDLFHTEMINKISKAYENDAEVKALSDYVTSDEVFVAALMFQSDPEIGEFIDWVYANDDLSNQIGKYFAKVTGNVRSEFVPSGNGLQSFLDDTLTELKIDDLIVEIQEKVNNDKLFAEFYERIHNLKHAFARSFKLALVEQVVNHFKTLHVNVDQIKAVADKIFGWE